MRNSSNSGRAGLWIAVIAVVLGIAAFLSRSPSRQKDSQTATQSLVASGGVASTNIQTSHSGEISSVIPSKALHPRKKLSPEQMENLWRGFQSSYGRDLQAVFTDDRRVASIRSGDEPATSAAGFQSGDRDAALARAQEILSHVAELIGLNSAFPLKAASVRSDDISSQVEWVQTFGGVPVEPYGRVTMQLDAQGGLRGLYSSYISDPLIGNQATLSASQARDVAVSSLPDQLEHPEQVRAGQLVLFAAGPQTSSSSVPLHYAYRFTLEGRQVTVDASSGKILSERDEREF